MSALQIQVTPLSVAMKQSFKHASAERSVSESVWVTATRGDRRGLGEGCPRIYVTGETLEGAVAWAQSKVPLIQERVQNLDDLKKLAQELSGEIDTHLSAWCALELAVLDLLAQEQGVSLEKLLNVSEARTRFGYAAVLSADNETKFLKSIQRYLSYGFSDFKMKVVSNPEEDFPRMEALKLRVEPKVKLLWPPIRLVAAAWAGRNPFSFRLRLDGNNAWAGKEEQLEGYLEKAPLKVWAIEEPFRPRDFAALSQLSQKQKVGIILDESLCCLNDVHAAAKHEGRWIANLRVSKLGGLLRSLAIVGQLKVLNWEIIVGAQVGETSVLSRAALVVARASATQLVSQEGAFGNLLLEEDPATPMIKFGLAGQLHNIAAHQKGLGLGET